MDDRLLKEFLADAEDLVEELYSDVAALRERRGPERRELIARVFRRIHTIKGTASAVELDATGEIAHEFESLLDAVRSGRAPLDDESLDACEDAVGAVAESLGAAVRGEVSEVPRGLVARLRSLAAAPAPVREDDNAELLPEEVARTLSAQERQRLSEATAEGARAYVVTVDFDLSDFDEQYRCLSESLGEVGEVVSTQPFVSDVGPDRVGFRIVYASAEQGERLDERAAHFGAKLAAAEGNAGGRERRTFDDEDDETSQAPYGETLKADALQSSSEANALQSSSVLQSSSEVGALQSSATVAGAVRVPLEELDDLISTTHGLFADTLGALDIALGQVNETAARAELEERARAVRRRFFELEERLIGLRMVALRGALVRAARAGRAVARAAGRRVEFEVAGGGARLDRSLAERVADPLLHLVRNAVDHGVETEEERRAAGKHATGRVRIEAGAEGGFVVLRVSDDGRGVDAGRVARAAADAGLIAPGTTLTDEQALRLIFRPGFSTVRGASLVSGRGVGLDVVERAVEEAGGEVRVRSERGRGTTFELRLPTTLALLPAHVFNSGGGRYCVAARQVIEWGEAAPEDIVQEGARRRLSWHGRELPLVEMRELLGRDAASSSSSSGERLAFFLVRGRQGAEGNGEARAAIVVDALEGQSEVLVRGLGRHAKRWRGVSGATELRDGSVALVLDLPRLLEGLD
ncbi:MAG: two-component system, chemotaxis family, sensor kinase CheA [Acidobacteriota bacterium]|jgi:two-component system chemotaxis sensor kinase CheA|nr:two-component system, chemotaxis family, sensor kinase CheA [Acidobacteriota bacterium]